MFDLMVVALVVPVVVVAKHLPSGIWNSMEINFFCFALLCFYFCVFLAWLFFQYVFLFFSLLFSSSSCRFFIFIFTFIIFGIFPVFFFFCSRFHFRPKFSVFV